jgi:hypothetical protein
MEIVSLLSTFAPISITVALLVLAELSRRLGEVVKRAPFYRWFYLAACFSFLSVMIRLLSLRYTANDFAHMGGNATIAIAYTGSLAFSVLLGIVVAWRYWGWLVYAGDGQTPIPVHKKHRS